MRRHGFAIAITRREGTWIAELCRSNSMRLIEEVAFPLAHDLKLVALQGDCGLREDVAAAGGRYVVDDANRARESCLSLVDRARTTHAHLALIPELVIPHQAVAELIDKIASNAEPVVVIGGVEGISPAEYRTLVGQHGGIPDVPETAAGTYVNAMLVAVRTATDLQIHFRAKRRGRRHVVLTRTRAIRE